MKQRRFVGIEDEQASANDQCRAVWPLAIHKQTGEKTRVETAEKPLEELVRDLPPHTHARAREYLEYLLNEPPRQPAGSDAAEPGPEAEVSLREVTGETVRAVCRLSDTLTLPKKYMVAPNAVSIAQAHFEEHAWFRAIYAGETPVGFVMIYDDPQAPEYFCGGS